MIRGKQRAGSEACAWLQLLQEAVDPHITGCTAELIKTSASPAKVYRLHVSYALGHTGAFSLILKTMAEQWPDDPQGADRECRFYRDVHPRLGLGRPIVYFSGRDPAFGRRAVLMEDAGIDHRFPSPRHRWTESEARCVLDAYARLHQRGEHCLPAPGERAWMYRLSLFAADWEGAELASLAHELAAWGVWPHLPRLESLIRKTLDDVPRFAAAPMTLLHNDVTPSNAALPHDLKGPALLFDWEMAGWGMAELDLAYMFTQPFGSERGLDKQAALDYYWQQRYALDGIRRAGDERRAAQEHAEALWALSLIPVAHRVVARPFPPDSAPAIYWRSMHSVVAGRLQKLSSG